MTFSVAISQSPSGIFWKRELPHRQHDETVVTDDADVDFASLDILLGDGGGADAIVDEIHPFGELFVGVDDGGLRNAIGGILVDAFDDERQSKPRRAFDLAALWKHGKGRHRDAMIMHQRLGQILAARQHQAARIAPGIGDPHELEIAGDVLVIDRLAVKLLEQA